MAYNGSGTFLINTAGQPVVAGTVISSTTFNALTADLATGLSTVITKDGQTTVTANIPMASFKFTGLGVGSAAGDSANLSQVQSTVTKLLTSVSGTDTITAVGAPVVAAYAAGQMFYFVATGDNTTSVTINIDGLGAKAVTRDGSVALVAGDIKSGEVVVVVYDGTRFQVVSQLNSAGNATFANVSITSALNVGGVATFSAGTAAAPSITTTGDTNTGLFFPAADTIAFTEGGAESMRIDSSGNVGIGTASPAVKLESAGTSNGATLELLRLNNVGSGANTQAQINFIAATASYGTITGGFGASAPQMTFNLPNATAGNFVWQITSTERMRLDTSGNLGIGTTSPGVKLDVQVAFNTEGTIRLTSPIDGSTATPRASSFSFRSGSGTVETARIASFNRFANVNGGDLVFSTADTSNVLQTRATLDSSGNLGLGTTSPGFRLDVATGTGRVQVRTGADTGGTSSGVGIVATNEAATTLADLNFRASIVAFITDATERARITAAGDFAVGTTSNDPISGNVTGHVLYGGGAVQHSRDNDNVMFINRKSSDGNLVQFYQDGTIEGSISVSGNTVSYNAFAGSHWSQLQDGSKPDILRGTVMESINELCVWPDETNERLPKSKVSDTAGSKKVYGVFMAWDNDWATTNDMYITAVGAFICRVNASVTVQEGDLLESNGDGTARVQADDIIRSSTIGKVTSTVKTHQYADGSYCVPTVLYCG